MRIKRPVLTRKIHLFEFEFASCVLYLVGWISITFWVNLGRLSIKFFESGRKIWVVNKYESFRNFGTLYMNYDKMYLIMFQNPTLMNLPNESLNERILKSQILIFQDFTSITVFELLLC